MNTSIIPSYQLVLLFLNSKNSQRQTPQRHRSMGKVCSVMQFLLVPPISYGTPSQMFLHPRYQMPSSSIGSIISRPAWLSSLERHLSPDSAAALLSQIPSRLGTIDFSTTIASCFKARSGQSIIILTMDGIMPTSNTNPL